MRTKKKLLISTCCCVNLSLLLTAAGCSPPGQPAKESVIPETLSDLTTTLTAETSTLLTTLHNGAPALSAESSVCPIVTTTLPAVELKTDPWLTVNNLQAFLPDLQSAAEKQGCAAAWRQPDPQSGQSFLTVAPGLLAAEQLNGFFFWLHDPRALDDQPELLLCIDRLFSDETRETALASGLYSEPRARDLLAFSLRQILGDCYEPAVAEFILNCYRTAFHHRINQSELAAQTWSQAFKHIEVTYEATIANTVSFRAISTGAAVA